MPRSLHSAGHVPGPVFQPGMKEGIYHGSDAKPGNVPLSQARASTLNIRFEVRGGPNQSVRPE